MYFIFGALEKGHSQKERWRTARINVSNWWPCSEIIFAIVSPAARSTLGTACVRRGTALRVGTALVVVAWIPQPALDGTCHFNPDTQWYVWSDFRLVLQKL